MSAIDLTDRWPDFGGARFVNRAHSPLNAIVLHHSAGWYGPRLSSAALADEEREQLDRLAADHRQRFAVGPGYHYAVFPSGRYYAVGKAGTSRAHTKGRQAETGDYWNERAIGIVVFGDYETAGADSPGADLVIAINAAVAEVKSFPLGLREPRLRVYGHGLAPTVDGAGVSYPQATSCPGRRLLPLLGTYDEQETRVPRALVEDAYTLLGEALGRPRGTP